MSALAWVALVPFLISISRLRPTRAFFAGLLWGSAAIEAIAYWVPGGLIFYYQQPWWFGASFFVIGSIILWGLHYAAVAAVVSWTARKTDGVAWVLVVAVAWVACELARARLVTGEPWMLLGYTQVPHVTLIQAADLGGVYLVSFVVVLTNASVAAALRSDATYRARVRPLAAAVAVLAVVYGYGRYRLLTPLPDRPSVPVAVVQGNLELGSQWRQEFYREGLDRYLEMSRKVIDRLHPRILIWPESSITFFLVEQHELRTEIGRLLQTTDTELLLGAPHIEGDEPTARYYNSAFHVTSDGQIAGRYDKAHLLPFAEYFPLRFIELLRRNFERVRTFTPGSGDVLLETRLGRTAVVICFEALFPELVRTRMARGADVLVNLSNDAWLGKDAGPAQHAAMVVLRAVENRTWVVRATTTGVSAVVDPYGRIRARADTSIATTLIADVVPMRIDTVYKRFGDVFAFACIGATVAAIAVLGTRRQKAQSRAS